MLYLGKENFVAEDVIRAQEKEPAALYNPCCSNIRKEYKRLMIEQKPSEVVALGTSRVLGIRQEFFATPANFTNAGQALTSLTELKDIGPLIKNKTKLVILALDSQLLNPEFISGDVPSDATVNLLATYWKKVYQDLLNRRTNIRTILHNWENNPHIGLVALNNLSGFKSDGSYEYGTTTSEDIPVTKQIDISIENLDKDRTSILYGKMISSNAIDSLEQFISYCHDNNIYVLGYMTPLPNRIYAKYASTNDVYKEMLTKIPSTLQPIFSKYNYKFYDLTNSGILGASEQDFIDPTHGTDNLGTLVINYLAARDKELAKFIQKPRR